MKPLLIFAFLAASLLAAEPHPSLPRIGSLDGLGVNIHFTDPQPGELEMIRAAGFRWVRMDLTWSGTEKARGEYDFSTYDRLVAALERNSLRALFILDYGNALYAEPGDTHPFTSRAGTEDFRAAYARWAAAAVARYAGKGFIFELWNEPNHEGFWKPKPKPNAQHYAALAKAACFAIAKAAPNEALIGPATSTIDLPFIEECFKAGLLEHWSAVSVRPYRQQAPETVEGEYRNLRLLISRYAPKDKAIPIVSSEWGYSTQYPAFAGKPDAEREQMQAKYLARMFLTNIANDVPLSIWYDWRDDGDNPHEIEHRFGIVRRAFRQDAPEPFEPKPAYRVAKALTTELGSLSLRQRQWFEREFMLLFANDSITRLVGWDIAHGSTGFELFMDDEKARPIPLLEPAVERRGLVSRELPLIAAAKDHGTERMLRLVADWQRLPLEIVTRAPSKVNLQLGFTRKPPRSTSVAFSGHVHGLAKLGTQTKDWKVRSDGVLTFWRPPSVQNADGSIRCELVVDVASRFGSPEVRHSLDITPETGSDPGLMQSLPLVIENRIELEMLPFNGEAAGCLFGNPSGEPGSVMVRIGSASDVERVRKGQASAQDVIAIVPCEFQLGEVEKHVHFTPPAGWNDTRGKWVASADGEGPFFGIKLGGQSPALRRSDLAALLRPIMDGDAGSSATLQTSADHPPAGPAQKGLQSLRVSYRFGAGWKFADLRFAEHTRIDFQSSVHPVHSLGVWLYGDGKGCQARLRFTDAKGQTFQPNGPKIDFNGWRFVRFPMQSTPESPLTHWGGTNDGIIQYPLKWDSILLLDNVSREPVEGEVYLSAPTLFY